MPSSSGLERLEDVELGLQQARRHEVLARVHPLEDQVLVARGVHEEGVLPTAAQHVAVGPAQGAAGDDRRLAPARRARPSSSASDSSQPHRSASVSGVPWLIFSTLAGGWKSSPSAISQPSRSRTAEAATDFPDPETPMKTRWRGAVTGVGLIRLPRHRARSRRCSHRAWSRGRSRSCRVVFTSIPKKRLTSQKPESLTWDRTVAPAAMASTSATSWSDDGSASATPAEMQPGGGGERDGRRSLGDAQDGGDDERRDDQRQAEVVERVRQRTADAAVAEHAAEHAAGAGDQDDRADRAERGVEQCPRSRRASGAGRRGCRSRRGAR